MSTLPKSFVTAEEYLEAERKAEYKSEYYNGEVFAMSAASRTHDRINTQLAFLIEGCLAGRGCEAFSANMRVLVIPNKLFTYPDLSVVCGEPQFPDPYVDTLTNPTLMVEILSPSTERYDRTLKASQYRNIASLRELLLISQEHYEVKLYRRCPDTSWSVFEAGGLDASVELVSIGSVLQLRDLYAKVLAADRT
jgi:Uma2 family endonuclease